MIEGVALHPLRQFVEDRGRTMHMLRNDDPQCWEAVFASPAVKNTDTQFKDKF